MDDYLNLPLTCINKIDKTINQDKKANKPNYLEIYTKDFRYMKLVFDSMEDCNNANLRIQMLAFPETELHDIFAFQYFYPSMDINEYLENGWDIYHSPDSEFKRQGLTFGNVYLKIFNTIIII